ncbi:MAG: ATP-binding protein [Pseudomonadota bacterium]|nr:ATP-binding protein [Pseudomonadota bacterium]
MSWDKVQESWKKVSGGTKGALGSLARGARAVSRGSTLAPERNQTDESLRLERIRTDQAVAARHEKATQQADAIVDRARDNADAVISAAREHADAVLGVARETADKSRAPDAGRAARAILREEREIADDALRDERDTADAILSEERQQQVRPQHDFLPLERESTDHSLRAERIRSDDALVNRDDFLAIVTHDLRDLLGGIVTSSAVLSTRALQDENGGNTLVETLRIGRYAARMNRLICDLVDITSIDAGKLAVAPSRGDLASLLREAVDSFQASASARGVLLENRCDAPLSAAFDHDRMLQVLGNLISNALKFTPRGGKVTLSGERDGSGVRISCADTGTGIPEEALESIFERFSQAAGNDHGGLGLGLYISRCLVDAHGGTIWAENNPGAGSTIRLTLPA